MENLDSLKKELKSTQELKEAVSTMKALAAANIKKYEKIVANVIKYQSNIDLGIQAILKQHPDILSYIDYIENSYSKQENGQNVLIVVGSNNGLCGRFNDRITDFFIENTQLEQNRFIITIGDRINLLVASKKFLIDKHFPVPNSHKQILNLVDELFEIIEKKLIKKNLAKVSIYFTSYNSKNKEALTKKKVLPLEKKYFEKLKNKQWPTNNIPFWRIEEKKLTSDFIQQYIFVSIYLSIVSSMAAEQFSRLTTLQRAEQNIKERLAELKLKYNQTRQNMITSELLDTIAGLKSLEHSNNKT